MYKATGETQTKLRNKEKRFWSQKTRLPQTNQCAFKHIVDFCFQKQTWPPLTARLAMKH